MGIDDKTLKLLIDAAVKAKENSYSPYSKYRVGAALLTADGKIYTGANVENASFGATICGERAAFVSAISDGARDFVAIAIAGDKEYCYPCGICRQFMSEFNKNLEVISVNGNGEYVRDRLPDLLAHMFTEF